MNQPSYPLSTNFSPAQLSATIGKVQWRTGMSITEGRGHVDCFASFRYSVGESSTQRPCEHRDDSSTCRKEVVEEEGGGRGGGGGSRVQCNSSRPHGHRRRVLCLLAVGSFWLPPVSPSQRTSPRIKLSSLEKQIWHIIIDYRIQK